MTVKELIAHLETLPPELLVVRGTSGHELRRLVVENVLVMSAWENHLHQCRYLQQSPKDKPLTVVYI